MRKETPFPHRRPRTRAIPAVGLAAWTLLILGAAGPPDARGEPGPGMGVGPRVGAAAAAPDTAEVRHPVVDSVFRDLEKAGGPGAAVLVLDGDEVLHRAGHGLAHLEHGVPITPSSVFDVASVAKPFTGMAVALLVEEGRISLDDDVREHVPELPDFGGTIRVGHLLHHTSGFRDWPGTLRLAGWDYADIISYDQILEMAYNQRDLNFAPGTEYTYSNTGYNLLAEIVARATGTPFAEWMQERIFDPLGMEDTHVHDHHGRLVSDRAASYRRADEGEGAGEGFRAVSNLLTAKGSSSLFTTVADLELWLRHLREPGDEVGGAAVVERMKVEGEVASGDGVGYAYGLSLGTHRGLRTLGHGGSWAGYRTQVLRYPEEDFAVVVLGNRNDLNAGRRARDVAQRFLGEAMDDPEPRRVAGPSDWREEGEDPEPRPLETPGEYAGEYRSGELRTTYRLEVRDGDLVARHFRRGEFPLEPREEDVFTSPGLGVVRFLRDDEGRVRAFRATVGQRNRDLHFERIR